MEEAARNGAGEGPEESQEIQEGFIAEEAFELDLERKVSV